MIEFPVGGMYRLTDFTLLDGEDGKWSRVEFLPGDVLLGVERVNQPYPGWRYTVLRVCGHMEESH